MSRLATAALALAATAVCAPLVAQSGAIVDPENPGASSGAIVDPENPGASPSAIVDPENPGASSGVIVDPENPGASPAPPPVAVAAPPEPAARASETRFRGAFASLAAVDLAHDVDGEDTFSWRSRVALSLRHRFSERWSATVAGSLVYTVNAAPPSDRAVLSLKDADWSAQIEPRLDDLVVSGRQGQWLFRLGSFVTSWGVSDFTNPVNIVNPRDYRAGLLAVSGENTLAVPTIDATWVSGRVAWQFLVIPFFVPHQIDIYGSDNAIGRSGSTLADVVPIGLVSQVIDPSLRDLVQPLLLQTRLPDELPQNISAGTRAVFTGGGADVGLGYFFGFDRQPHIATSASLQAGLALLGLDAIDELSARLAETPEARAIFNDIVAGEPLFSAEYRRQHTATLDFVRYFGPIGVRIEAAFSPERSFYTTQATTLRRPSLSTAFGLGWESGTGELVIGAEVFHSYGFTRTGDGDFVLGADELLGVAWGIDWDFGSIAVDESAWSRVGLRVGGVVLPQDSAALFSPELRYELTEATDIAAGALIVVADNRSGVGDLYRGNGQAWLRVATVF